MPESNLQLIIRLCSLISSALAMYFIEDNGILVDHKITSIYTKYVLECCAVCAQTNGCNSVSYNGASQDCQLNDKNPLVDDTAVSLADSRWTTFYNISYCRPGWTYYKKACYLLGDRIRNFTESEAYCQGQGGHLMDINDPDEEQFFFSLGPFSYRVWIGLNNMVDTQTYVWTSGASYSHQLTIDGINVENPDDRCIGLYITSDWFSMLCTGYMKCVCEIKLNF